MEDNDCFKSILMEDFNNLTNKITVLENDLVKVKKENSSLKINLNKLESIVEKLCNHLNLNMNNIGESNSPNVKKSIPSSMVKTSNNGEEETWLYYVKVGEKRENILKALEMKNDTQILEFNTLLWTDENKMLINVLQNFKKFQEFAQDWQNMNNKQLKHYVHEIVSSTLINDFVFLLKGLPNKKSKSYDQVLSFICTFTGIIFNICEEMEKNNDSLGIFN